MIRALHGPGLWLGRVGCLSHLARPHHQTMRLSRGSVKHSCYKKVHGLYSLCHDNRNTDSHGAGGLAMVSETVSV